MDRALSKLGGPGVELEQATAWLVERAKEEDFSLTDLWGVLTSAGIMKQVTQLTTHSRRSKSKRNKAVSCISSDGSSPSFRRS